ncbi:MAG: polymer-forming cytoskeletal protein, partial [Fusobacteriaceae bacterium]
GIILGGVLSDEEPRLSSSNTEDLILENRGNGDRIVMTKSGGLELYTSIHVKIDSPTTHITGILNVDGDINGKSNLTIDKNIIGKGNLDITGNATVTGNIAGKAGLSVAGGGTVTGSLKGGTIETSKGTTLDGHTHQYNPGPGGPTPTAPGQG